MARREMLGMLGAGAAGRVAMTGGAALAQDQGRSHPGDRDRRGHNILDECALVCNERAAHCLHRAQQGGIGGRAKGQDVHLRAHEATLDRQAFCHLASALMARRSPYAAYAHRCCADACPDCAAACDQGPDDVMTRCAGICRQQAQQRVGAGPR